LRDHGARHLSVTHACHRVQATLKRLASCRTELLGGHVVLCNGCGDVRYLYHSCGDRHCPACGGTKRSRWLEARRAEQLPVPYFHVVFTLPHELSALILGNRKALYDLLFEASWQTLSELGADPKHMGAQMGAVAVLHTWGQQMEHHPHVHMIVPGGGISLDGTSWVASRPRFLLPVKVMGKLFRGKYLAGLRQAYVSGELAFGGSTTSLSDPATFEALMSTLYAKDWVVYAKEPFSGPDTMLKYLTGYTHRVALSNYRLSKYDGSHVSLSYKDYADGCQRKELRLEACELVRRFCLHIVPKGLVRVRHFGIMTHRDRGKRLAKCRELLGVKAASDNGLSTKVSAKPPLLLALLFAVMVTMGTPSLVWKTLPHPVETCRKCGSSDSVTVWQGARPSGHRWLEVNPWNST